MRHKGPLAALVTAFVVVALGPRGARAQPGARPPGARPPEARPPEAPESVEVRLEEPSHRVPTDVPHAIVSVPGDLEGPPDHAVVFLHGFRGCARVLAHAGPAACRPGMQPRAGWALARRLAEATDAVLVVPQLAFLARDGSPGKLRRPGFGHRWLGRILAAARASTDRPVPALNDLRGLTLVAHSAGYRAAAALIEAGDLGRTLDAVVLLDALYGRVETFARWILAVPQARRLVVIHTGRGTPATNTRRLARSLETRFGVSVTGDVPVERLGATLADHAFVSSRSPHPHGSLPRRHLVGTVTALEAWRR